MSDDTTVSLVLFSGTDDKLQAAAVLAVGVSPEAGEVGLRAMQDQGKPHWSDLFRQAKDLGGVAINACADSMEMFRITKDDLDPLVDGVWGVASFWMAAEDGPVTFI
jgi:peroxiredoxin family protein